MSFRSGERKDGTSYHYPLAASMGGGYTPSSLETTRIPAASTQITSVPNYFVKFYYDSDWFPTEVVKATPFPQQQRESIEHAKELRSHKDLKIVGVEVIDPNSHKVISAEGRTEKHVGEVADLGEQDYEVEEE